jgi:NADPH-dependent F420 reductase
MRIALLGGTGDIGEGLALRWGKRTDHTIAIGSRDDERGRAAANDYARDVPSGQYVGGDNRTVSDGADVIVLSVPSYHVESVIETIRGSLSSGTILVTPAAGLKSDDEGVHFNPPPAGSVTRLVEQSAPEDCPVVGCFHNVPAEPLADLDTEMDLDTPLIANDDDARESVDALVDAIPGMNTVHAGPIANAPEIESLVPLLLNLKRYGSIGDGLSIRIRSMRSGD